MKDHNAGIEVRATCNCGWRSDTVHAHGDVSASHRAALMDFAAHVRDCEKGNDYDSGN